MGMFETIMIGIGIIVGLIVLVVLMGFLIELIKAFSQMGKKDSKRGDVNNGPNRGDGE